MIFFHKGWGGMEGEEYIEQVDSLYSPPPMKKRHFCTLQKYTNWPATWQAC